jgi:DNA-binding MarR family transcriptional regulator/GNAT superfamily N-acetyltransferase
MIDNGTHNNLSCEAGGVAMTASNLDQRIDAIRSFNRFYTRKIGVLHEKLLNGPFSLSEVRVLRELAHKDRPTASEIARELGLDMGYLSRILSGFENRGLICKEPSPTDARQSLLCLTDAGLKEFAPLNVRANEEVAATLETLTPAEQDRLLQAMGTIQRLLGDRNESSVPYILRTHQPGDMGWVVQRHGALYAQEYGWGEEFEAMVVEIVAKFIQHFDPKRERCWIAEREGTNVGSIFLVKGNEEVAKLRLLLVEPAARGLGIGRRLVQECVRFARQARYRKMTLWTNSVLHAARHLYEEAGFQLVREEPHDLFGKGLVGQTWELSL